MDWKLYAHRVELHLLTRALRVHFAHVDVEAGHRLEALCALVARVRRLLQRPAQLQVRRFSARTDWAGWLIRSGRG